MQKILKPCPEKLKNFSKKEASTSDLMHANQHYSFSPKFKVVAKVPPTAAEQDFLKEKSIYSATLDFAKENGGPITHSILKHIPKDYYNIAKKLNLYPNIDIRIHKFEKFLLETNDLTLYPAIPGLHWDGEWREAFFGQTKEIIRVSHHLFGTIATSTGISNTRFLMNNIKSFRKTENREYEYELWKEIEKIVSGIRDLKYYQVPDGHLTLFDPLALHEATPAKFPGLRYFFRCSLWSRPNLEDSKLTLSEQLYITFKPSLLKNHVQTKKTISLSSIPHHRVVDNLSATFTTEQIIKEDGFSCALPEYVKNNGGPIAQYLVDKIPRFFLEKTFKSGLQPRIDYLIFRLYPSFQPNIPAYDKTIRLPGWHLPLDENKILQLPRPEILISLSNNPKGINNTELLVSEFKIDISNAPTNFHFWYNVNNKINELSSPKNVVVIKDNEVVLTTSHTFRRESFAINRGWRIFFRVSMQDVTQCINEGEKIKQQYVSLPINE